MTKSKSWLPDKLRPMRSPFRRYYDEIVLRLYKGARMVAAVARLFTLPEKP